MLGTLLDKATGILDRQFLIAYWFPVFIASFITILIRIYVCGMEAALSWWQQDLMLNHQRGFYAQIWFIVGILITITVLAYLLKPFTRPMMRIYEGYWPLTLWEVFKRLPKFGEMSKWKKMTDQKRDAELKEDWEKYNQLQIELFYNYPRKENRIMPTRFGNAMRAAEDYSSTVYGMDSVFWWPRLWLLLPELVKNDLDDSFVPIVALLNISSLLITVEAIFVSRSLWQDDFGCQALLLSCIGLILAFIYYRAAVEQTKIYGKEIRATIDLYRFDLFRALHQQLPETLCEEMQLWKKLMDWAYINDRSGVADMTYRHDNGH